MPSLQVMVHLQQADLYQGKLTQYSRPELLEYSKSLLCSLLMPIKSCERIHGLGLLSVLIMKVCTDPTCSRSFFYTGVCKRQRIPLAGKLLPRGRDMPEIIKMPELLGEERQTCLLNPELKHPWKSRDNTLTSRGGRRVVRSMSAHALSSWSNW